MKVLNKVSDKELITKLRIGNYDIKLIHHSFPLCELETLIYKNEKIIGNQRYSLALFIDIPELEKIIKHYYLTSNEINYIFSIVYDKLEKNKNKLVYDNNETFQESIYQVLVK